jgi:hypothetical protein
MFHKSSDVIMEDQKEATKSLDKIIVDLQYSWGQCPAMQESHKTITRHKF